MYQLLAKKGQLFAIGLGGIVVAIFLVTVFSGLSSAGYNVGSDLNEIMKANPDQTFNMFDVGLKLTGALIVIALFAAVIFGVIQLIGAPKQSIKGIIGMAVIAILFYALYASSSSDGDHAVLGPLLDKFNVSDNVSKLISGGISTTLILGGLALVSMILFEIYNMFK